MRCGVVRCPRSHSRSSYQGLWSVSTGISFNPKQSPVCTLDRPPNRPRGSMRVILRSGIMVWLPTCYQSVCTVSISCGGTCQGARREETHPQGVDERCRPARASVNQTTSTLKAKTRHPMSFLGAPRCQLLQLLQWESRGIATVDF